MYDLLPGSLAIHFITEGGVAKEVAFEGLHRSVVTLEEQIKFVEKEKSQVPTYI